MADCPGDKRFDGCEVMITEIDEMDARLPYKVEVVKSKDPKLVGQTIWASEKSLIKR